MRWRSVLPRVVLTGLMPVLVILAIVAGLGLSLGPGEMAGVKRVTALVFAGSMGFAGLLVVALLGAASTIEFLRSRDRRSEHRRHESAHKV